MGCGLGTLSGSTWPFAAHVVPDKLFGQHQSKRLVVHCSGRNIIGAKNVRVGYGHIEQETKNVLVVFSVFLGAHGMNLSTGLRGRHPYVLVVQSHAQTTLYI